MQLLMMHSKKNNYLNKILMILLFIFVLGKQIIQKFKFTKFKKMNNYNKLIFLNEVFYNFIFFLFIIHFFISQLINVNFYNFFYFFLMQIFIFF